MRIIGLAGWSGAGKTTLVARLVPALIARGISVSTVKHAHHDFDVDQPGKDSHTHRQAGAAQVLVASAHRWALMTEHRGAPETTLRALLGKLDPVDLVGVEGFKRDPVPKIEIFRGANGQPFLYPGDPLIRAVASDVPLPEGAPPSVHLDDIEAIAEAALRHAEGF
jgi:molybdopterin-guanine dinucleotide biosynthesis protein B